MRPPKIVIFIYIKFCDISGQKYYTVHDDRQFADFNEVGYLEFMKRSTENQLARATILRWLFYVCTHLLYFSTEVQTRDVAYSKWTVLTRPPPFSLAFGERATAKVEPYNV